MYKLLSLFVLVALAVCVFATEEKQDQETAEQFFLRYGYYPSWYSYGAVRAYAAPFAYSAYPYAYNYPYYGFGYNYVY